MRRSSAKLASLTVLAVASPTGLVRVATASAEVVLSSVKSTVRVRLAELETWLVDELARISHVVFFEHLLKTDFVEFLVKHISMLVEYVLVNELSGFELFITEQALIY